MLRVRVAAEAARRLRIDPQGELSRHRYGGDRRCTSRAGSGDRLRHGVRVFLDRELLVRLLDAEPRDVKCGQDDQR